VKVMRADYPFDTLWRLLSFVGSAWIKPHEQRNTTGRTDSSLEADL